MIAVGVSGHRNLQDLEIVSNAVDEALREILAAFGDNSLQVISPLAEGADRLVAWRAMANYSVCLIVPLPLEMSDYMLDFNSRASRSEFSTLIAQADRVFELPEAETREAAYLASGMYVLDHSDVLIAVWDGEPARGTGGTAEIVAEARRRGMPIAWVQVAGKTQTTDSGAGRKAKSMHVYYERFPNVHKSEAGGL